MVTDMWLLIGGRPFDLTKARYMCLSVSCFRSELDNISTILQVLSNSGMKNVFLVGTQLDTSQFRAHNINSVFVLQTSEVETMPTLLTVSRK
jgi:hypothetical protein